MLEKHSGFVINKGNATAKDITDLIKHIQDEVKKQFGVDLHTEVRIIGEEQEVTNLVASFFIYFNAVFNTLNFIMINIIRKNVT